MFYNLQSDEQKTKYKDMLTAIGELSVLFSDNECPYLPYRAHENIFCKAFEAENLARSDCSADAKKSKIGIGLKTWMGNDDQKVAEFGKLRETYSELSGLDLVKKISEYRNERIRVTKNLHGIDDMLYHIVKRIPGAMQILECDFIPINLDEVKLIPNRGNYNNTYFTDGKHTYHFSRSKNTLFMVFENMDVLDEFEVGILADPYKYLLDMRNSSINVSEADVFYDIVSESAPKYPQICLKLYAEKKDGTKFVPEKSGLNQWNAGGRKRDENEIYIGYPSEDRQRTAGFFPPRDTPFKLSLPDGTIIDAKVCQQDGKAIMSNPNKVLGEWLLRNVFELETGSLVTYEMLEKFGVDSVVFTKYNEKEYAVDFAEIGTYEKMLEENREE